MTPSDLAAIKAVVVEALTEVLAAHAPKPEPKKPRGGLLTLAEAGELVRHAPGTVRRWIWEGRLKAYKPGRHPLVRESELLELVNANESTAKRVARRRAKAVADAAASAGRE